MDLSYTQNLEDFHLTLAFAGQPTGFYIDVGGGHPVADNVTYWFYLRGWRGVTVEPQRALTDLHRRLRPRDAVFEGIVGRRSASVAFHEVERFHGLSTTVEGFAKQAAALGTQVRTVHVPCLTLDDLCEREGVQEIDILKIDVEGAEGDVLAGIDLARRRPKVILAEAIEPGSGAPAWESWEPLLLAADYRFVLFDTLNRFYVAAEQAEILGRFPRERAPWDSAVHMYEIGRAPDNPRHPEHRLARDLARGLWAELPRLDPSLVARLALLGRGGTVPDEAAAAALAAELDTDAGRARLGRIACGYDGGQIVDGEEEQAAPPPA
ncbi:MAG: FkbM family methyltransferase [Alsobacter sp.]